MYEEHNNRRQFFFDTADEKLIENWWSKLNHSFEGKDVAGITSNPNALQKVNVKTVEELKAKLVTLGNLLGSIRKDRSGHIYVQMPNSNMGREDIKKFAQFLYEFGRANSIVLGLKIPPFHRTLEMTSNLWDLVPLNVTGVADCSTALRAFSYPVTYVSIIPGRMEEKNINAREQVAFVQQRNNGYARSANRTEIISTKKRLITGSMRTLVGLQWAIEYGTVPTIGSKLFDKLVESPVNVEYFHSMWNVSRKHPDLDFSPHVTQDMTDLSVSFFEQMDECGKELYEDFSNDK